MYNMLSPCILYSTVKYNNILNKLRGIEKKNWKFGNIFVPFGLIVSRGHIIL